MIRILTLPALLLSCALAGCGGDAENIPVVAAKGKVTYNNLPLDGATLVFAPLGDSKYVPTALSGAGGEFVLNTNNQEGAPPGTYKVIVSKMVSTEPKLDSSGHEEVPATSKLMTPEKYSKLETTDIQLTIPEEGTETMEVTLK